MASLRLRLLLALLSLNMVVWLILALATYWSSAHEVEELFDAQLAQSARVLKDIALQAHTPLLMENQDASPIDFLGHPYEKHIAFQIWQHDQLTLHSNHTVHLPLSDMMGFSTKEIDGVNWRVFALEDKTQAMVIHVAEKEYVRFDLTKNVAYSILLPLLAAMPLLAGLIWYSIGRGIRPLQSVAAAVSERTPQQLAPVETKTVPVEAMPLVKAINNLLERLHIALDNERHFTADAAHELRTPLASLKVQAQVAARAEDPEVRQRALQQIIVGVNRSTHLVEQLLTLARLDPEAVSRRVGPCMMQAIAEEILADLAHSFIQKGIDLSLNCVEEVMVLGDRVAIGVLLRNLVDNAIRYTPTNGLVEVSIAREPEGICLSVEDSGPGIPPETWAEVFKRFRRGNHQENYGCGLGLSIVKRIAELHHATINLNTGHLGGLRIEVLFPHSE